MATVARKSPKAKSQGNQEVQRSNIKNFIVFHKFYTWSPSRMMTLCMRQMVDSIATRTMPTLISWIAVLMASFKLDIVCGWNWYTLDSTYSHSQKTIGVRSGELGGQGNRKWREITLLPNCWLKRRLTEDPTCGKRHLSSTQF